MSRPAIALLLGAAIAGVVYLLGAVLSDFNPYPEIVTPAAAPVISLPLDCESVCAKMDECGIKGQDQSCESGCNVFFSLPMRSCIMESECALIQSDCLADASAYQNCISTCRLLENCDVMEMHECADQCREFEPALISCIEETPCEDIKEECFPTDPEQKCEPACDKLLECRLWEPDQEFECMEFCAEQPSDVVDCVQTAPCTRIEDWCFGISPDLRCGQFCDKMIQCDQWDSDDYEECMSQCDMEAPALTDCVTETDCEALNFCFENPFPFADCDQYCTQLVDCGFYEPWAWLECWNDCALEPGEALWCAIETPCDQIEQRCWIGLQEQACRESCDKLAGCGLEVDMPECREVCFDEWSPDMADCILEAPCDSLGADCLGESAQEACPEACVKLSDCALPELASQCEKECVDFFSGTLINCILETDCADIPSLCQ